MSTFKLKPKPTTSASKTKKNISIDEWTSIQLLSELSSEFSFTLKIASAGRWEITQERCRICWKPVIKGNMLIQCPFCQSPFHGHHWEQWILKKGSCPVCRKKITR